MWLWLISKCKYEHSWIWMMTELWVKSRIWCFSNATHTKLGLKDMHELTGEERSCKFWTIYQDVTPTLLKWSKINKFVARARCFPKKKANIIINIHVATGHQILCFLLVRFFCTSVFHSKSKVAPLKSAETVTHSEASDVPLMEIRWDWHPVLPGRFLQVSPQLVFSTTCRATANHSTG